MKTRKQKKTKAVMPLSVCPQCGNHYLVIWVNEGPKYHDFGERHCPFCGLINEEFYRPAMN